MTVLCTLSWVKENPTSRTDTKKVPLSLVFHDMGWNALHSVTHNYGLNFIGAGAGTWAFIESGLDWRWNRLAYHNAELAASGMPALYIGYAVPAITPLAFFFTGRAIQNDRLQITALALTQTLALTLGIQSVIKISTGRGLPGIVTELDHRRSNRTDDFSKEFDWFNMDFIGGWPSGHTANAFAAAATIAELYRGHTWLQAGVWTYAALIGLGVSVNVHWASDVWAGALIGLAIGKTVGKSFRRILEKRDRDMVSLSAGFNSVGIVIRR
jgi:membrane-associated phospholipid phosphatase